VKKAKNVKKSGSPVRAAVPAAAKAAPKGQLDSALVRQLAGILNETGLSEIEYEAEGRRIRVARNVQQAVLASAAPLPVIAATPAAVAAAPAAAPAAEDLGKHPGAVKAPMVGVAYLAPEPGAAQFARVGDTVSEGQTLLLIEAMKTFNPVKAPRGGKLTHLLVENGAPVEYDQPLAVIA
jgi:acetyl-CoA carboxylase biotin carboxyl carrier protein